MSSCYELQDSRKVSLEPVTGRVLATTTWNVTLDSIAQRPDAVTGFPTSGMAHPQASTATYDSFDIVKQTDALGLQYIVTAKYASFRDFALTTQLRIREECFSLGTVEIPYAVQRPTSFASPGLAPVLVYVWDIQKLRRERKQQIVTVKLFQNSYGQAEASLISAQYGKYHYLSATAAAADTNKIFRYKFIGCQVQQIKTTWWQYVYSWVTEEPITYILPAQIKGFTPFNLTSTILFPTSTQGQNGSGFALDPFQEFITIPSPGFASTVNSGDVQSTPGFAQIRKYAETDVSGYAGASGLPGAPV